jgi:hypothetical protein
MAREKISRRQKDISRLLREKKKMKRDRIKKTRKKSAPERLHP